MNTYSRISLMMLFCGLLAGCGENDEKTPQNNNDEVTNNSNSDTPDTGDQTNNDAPDMADVVPDAGQDMGAECDPALLAAELVASNDTAAVATLDVEPVGSATSATLDASLGGPQNAAGSSWVYISLDSESVVEVSDVEAISSRDWDLAFKRAEIRLNSADSGPRTLLLSKVESDYESAEPPAANAEWTSDDFIDDTCETTTFGQGSIQTAFGQWYDYDPATHTVSAPENISYFIYDPTTHAVFKLAIDTYESGVYQLRWEVLSNE